MKKFILSLIPGLLLFSCLASAQINTQLADTLNKVLTQKAKQYNLKSVAAAVVFPDGSVWEGVYGNCGATPTSSNMLFEMGSNTKTYTAALILQLAHEGKLNLNDTIYRFLPVHPNIAYKITIRQLLNHTSGIYNYTSHPEFVDFVNGNPDAIVNVDSIISNWVGAMVFTPGKNWQYSNTNYLLLGKIIEAVDGVPYHTALRNRFLDKFGFNESFMDVYDSYSIPKAQTWLNNGQYWDENFKSFMSSAWAAGAMITSPRDLAKWAKYLYSGEILPASWLDSMKVTLPLGGSNKYGLGMIQRSFNGKTYLGHGGTTLQNSEMEYSVSSDFSVVTVVNEQDKGSQSGLIQNNLINVIEKLLPTVTSINEKNNHENTAVTFYPNPATESFRVNLSGEFLIQNPSCKLNIYTLSGVLQKSVFIKSSEINISRENSPNGLYIVNVINNQGNVVSRNKISLQ